MDATAKQAANFAKVRTKIIEPAVKELQERRRLADSVAPDQGGPQGQGGALHLHA
jgi:hypothetical protein